MIDYFRGILFKDVPRNRLERTADGQWMVTRKSRILYIGSKKKCKTYLDHVSAE